MPTVLVSLFFSSVPYILYVEFQGGRYTVSVQSHASQAEAKSHSHEHKCQYHMEIERAFVDVMLNNLKENCKPKVQQLLQKVVQAAAENGKSEEAITVSPLSDSTLLSLLTQTSITNYDHVYLPAPKGNFVSQLTHTADFF